MAIRLYGCDTSDDYVTLPRAEGPVPLGDILRDLVIPAAAWAVFMRKREERRN